MAFITGLLLITLTAFISLFITFKFFPKYQMGWKDKLWIALITIGALMIIEIIIYFFQSFVNTLDTNKRPAFSSVAFENFTDAVGEVVWFILFPLGIVFSIAGVLFLKAGVSQDKAYTIALVWGVITIILWMVVLGLRSLIT